MNKITRISNFLSQKGQTTVEYVLIIMVAASLVWAVGGKLKTFLVGRDGECPNESFFCKILDQVTGEGGFGGDFRYFTLRR
ncbi:MAG: hypothetical protein HQK53_14660 [Oligoflexia bacterium]|nr:hypothetical protein [Oligoflexia bacterium]